VVAIGKQEFVRGSWVKPGAVVIDVGIHQVPDATKKSGFSYVGDVCFSEVCILAFENQRALGVWKSVRCRVRLKRVCRLALLSFNRLLAVLGFEQAVSCLVVTFVNAMPLCCMYAPAPCERTGGAQVLLHHARARRGGAYDHHHADEEHGELVPQRPRAAPARAPEKPEPRELGVAQLKGEARVKGRPEPLPYGLPAVQSNRA